MTEPNRKDKFRVAIRRFGPFESAIRQQWEAFEKEQRSGLTAEAEALDLHPLHDSLFTSGGLKTGDCDIAFLSTDWLAGAHETQALVDLTPYLEDNPPDGYPGAWTDSLLRFQRFENRVLGLPYHDGPECLVYRTDLFEDPGEQAAYREQSGEPLRPPKTWPEFHRMA